MTTPLRPSRNQPALRRRLLRKSVGVAFRLAGPLRRVVWRAPHVTQNGAHDVRHGARIDPARSEKPRSLLNAPPPESSILPRARIITGTEIVSETVKGLLHC